MFRSARPGEAAPAPSGGEGGTIRKAIIGTAAAILTAVGIWFVTFGLDEAAEQLSEPILVRLITDPATIGTFENQTITMVMAQPPTGSPPSGCVGFQPWAREQGAIDLHTTQFRLIVQGATDQAVTISRISADIRRQEAVSLEVVLECPSAGAVEARGLEIDLDSPNPTAVYQETDGERIAGLTLARGETEYLDIAARTSGEEATVWALSLELVVDGRTETRTIENGGDLFTTVGGQGTEVWSWELDHWSRG